MTNPFHPDNLVPNWTEATHILKGDVPGHEFHGNQYTGVVAHNIAKTLDENTDMGNDANEWRQAHVEAAGDHNKMAQALEKSGQGDLAKLHRDAAGAHADAIRSYTKDGSDYTRTSGSMDAWRNAYHASEKAENASGRGDLPSRDELSE